MTADIGLIDWSRAQFALTAMYHWLFVPLTLGLALIMGIMETAYYATGRDHWLRTAKFWMKLFGVNFAMGVATGLILEFEFGTNWSNYSQFVGDIFGAPLAIEGIVAFFMESTFVAVMFFGWNKVSRGFHLASTWLTGLGATISAWWILVANAWMQHPVGMTFNPATVRNEMTDFAAVALSPTAVTKFFHTVASGWVVGAAFVVGVSCWFLLRRRDTAFALRSLKTGAIVGLVATLAVALTGDRSGVEMGRYQPMKLAAAEGLQKGGNGVAFTVVGDIKVPKVLSILATHDIDGYVPGIEDILAGRYFTPEGKQGLPAGEKMKRGRQAVADFAAYRKAMGTPQADVHAQALSKNADFFGYGYIRSESELVPPVDLVFWSFRVMVGAGGALILWFLLVLVLLKRKVRLPKVLLIIGLLCIPLAYAAGQAGWIVAEVGRQPWAVQDLLPLGASVSALPQTSVKITFFVFAAIFTMLLIAGITIMLRAIAQGPEPEPAAAAAPDSVAAESEADASEETAEATAASPDAPAEEKTAGGDAAAEENDTQTPNL